MSTDIYISGSKHNIQLQIVGHLGLVGAFIRESGLIKKIDSLLPKTSNHQGHFTHGEVVALMILNGLGYTSKPLYMCHTYFENKDVSAILGIEFRKEWFNDDVIGRTMDALHAYGLTDIFSQLSLEIMSYLGRKISTVNIDSTSFHYHGQEQKYDRSERFDYTVPHKINITRGYSRDAHPELVQIMEQMMVDNSTGIPLFMEPEDGNTNDTKAFRRMVQVFDRFKQYTDDGYVYLCGDAALYSEGNIQEMDKLDIKYITRAADGKIKCVQEFIAEHRDEELEEIDDVNQGKIYEIEHDGIKQKWLLVHSNTAEGRNEHSVMSRANKELENLEKELRKYTKTFYSCAPDAQKEINRITKKCKYCKVVNSEIIAIEKGRPGRKPKNPKPDEPKEFQYQINITPAIDEEYCQTVMRNKSFFVIATNDTERNWTSAELLKLYKTQNRVERGFRFLKDPEFFADSIFVSKNEHMQALLMIMTLSLAVFSGLEWKLQNAMQETGTQLKNQQGKLQDKITMRFVFQQFDGVITAIINNTDRYFDNIKEQPRKILKLLGKAYEDTYT